MNEQNEKKITVKVHPYIAAYLTQGKWPWSRSVVKQWAKKNNGSIEVESSTNYAFMEYHIYNSRGEEIRLS